MVTAAAVIAVVGMAVISIAVLGLVLYDMYRDMRDERRS